MRLVRPGLPFLELGELGDSRQIAVEDQVGDLHEAALGGQLLDGVAAVGQDALVAVDVADGRGLGQQTLHSRWCSCSRGRSSGEASRPCP